MEGGMDFCASLFWWFEAEGGNKCKKITSGSKNPCKTPDTKWTLSMVNNGRKAYVQAIQRGWGNDAWQEMYLKHVRVAIQEEMKLLGKKPSGKKEWREKYEPKVLSLMPMILGMTEKTDTDLEAETNTSESAENEVFNPEDFDQEAIETDNSSCDISARDNCIEHCGGKACFEKFSCVYDQSIKLPEKSPKGKTCNYGSDE